MADRLTLKDLAARMNLSISTVSRALQNKGEISEITRNQVKVAAEELGYRPDPALSALVAYRAAKYLPKRGESIAYLAYSPEHQSATVFARYLSGTRKACAKLGYSLEFHAVGPLGKLPINRLSDVLYQRGIRGVLAAPDYIQYDTIRFDLSRFATVAIEYALPNILLNRVSGNYFVDIATVFNKLQEYGYQRIGFAMHPHTEIRSMHRWLGGFLFKQEEAAIRSGLEKLPVCHHNDGPEFRDWLKATRPDVVIGRKNLLLELEKAGLRCPRDIGFAHLGVPNDNSLFSGICLDCEGISEAAVRLLDSSLQHNELGIPQIPEDIAITQKWVEGSTLARITSAHHPSVNVR